MARRIHGIRIGHEKPQMDALRSAIDRMLGKNARELKSFRIARRSVDARKKTVHFVYSIDLEFKNQQTEIDVGIEMVEPFASTTSIVPGKVVLTRPPLIVGAGPSGLFAALVLSRQGYSPVLLDRGGDVDERKASISELERTRQPDPECNALFGLGGAGTFSDGKLNTSLSHPWIAEVLRTFNAFGAPSEILFDAKPHIGTDVLGPVITGIAEEIRRLGGKVVLGTKMIDMEIRNGKIAGITTDTDDIPTDCLVVGIGHSARDTWQMLERAGVKIVPKPFQMGVRVEHPQLWLNERQWGKAAGHPNLGAADYKLATRVDNGIPVFSFCMCPGGYIIPTVNESEHLCINGMSRSARDSKFANSGVVVTIKPEELNVSNLAGAVSLVKNLENLCFSLGGKKYSAPAQTLLSFVSGSVSKYIRMNCSYSLGLTPVDLRHQLPKFIADPLAKAFSDFDAKIPGYVHPESIVLAPEARASSPVRILRDEITRESVSIGNLFPVGEGAGYAGGIMSSALDGMTTARKIVEKFAPPNTRG